MKDTMVSEFEFLRERALDRSKLGRQAIRDAERRFYDAITRFRQECYRFQFPKLAEEMIADICDFPCVLRSVLDAEDEANQALLRAMQVKKTEAFLASLPPTETKGEHE